MQFGGRDLVAGMPRGRRRHHQTVRGFRTRSLVGQALRKGKKAFDGIGEHNPDSFSPKQENGEGWTGVGSLKGVDFDGEERRGKGEELWVELFNLSPWLSKVITHTQNLPTFLIHSCPHLNVSAPDGELIGIGFRLDAS